MKIGIVPMLFNKLANILNNYNISIGCSSHHRNNDVMKLTMRGLNQQHRVKSHSCYSTATENKNI